MALGGEHRGGRLGEVRAGGGADPALTGRATPPEWAFAFLVAAPAVLGAWLAAKTQRFVPDSHLRLLTGVITGLGGLLYLINYFVPLPFRV